jgi:hypothetical protein
MIGGAMKEKRPWKYNPMNLPTEYKLELDAAGQTHRFKP